MADFNYKLEDLIDVGSVSQMFKLLYEVANIPNALIDMNGNILAGAGWQSICTDFHRKNPTSEAVCIESDIHIRNEISAGQPHCVYECPLGLVDSSCPVIIGGHHVGSVFTGQMLHTPLTDDVRDRFRAQAKQYGYDEKAYLEALEQVPVFPIEKHTAILKLLANIAKQLGASGLTKLKTIEQGKKLQESEQYFKAISTQSSEGISVTDMDGNYTFVNPAFCEMVGWSEAELLKMQAPDLASQDQEPNTFKRSISVDEGVPLTVELMRKDGSEFLAEVTGKVLSRNGIQSALGTIRDITKRSEDELLLRASEAKLNTIIQTSIEGYWLVDLEGRFLDVNDAYLKMSGYRKAELLGMRISDIESLETPEETAKHLEAVALAGSARFESIHHRKDGSAFSVDVSVQFQAFEGGRFVVFVRDITDRKQAEMELAESKNRFQGMFENHNAIMLLIEPDSGKILDANKSAENFYGYSISELCSMSIDEINCLSPEQVSAERIKAKNMKRNYFIFSHKLKSGEVRNVEVHSTPIKENNVNLLFSIIHDITNRKLAEASLGESEEKFRGVYEQSPIAIEIYDKTGKLVDVNQTTLDMFGIDNKKYVLGFDLWADPNLTSKEMKTLKNGKPIYISTEFDFELVKEHNLYPTTRSGIMYMDMYAIPLMDKNDITGYLVQIVEVTERRRAEEHLVRAKGSLEKAQSSAKIGSWEMDPITKKLSWSKQMFQILEVNPDEEPSFELFYSRIHPDDLAYVQEVGARVYAGNEAAKAEYRLQMPSGSIKHIATEGYREFEGEEVVKLTGIVQDITERKQAEDELKKKMDEMQRFHNLIVDREFAMIELKKEVNDLLKKSGADEKIHHRRMTKRIKDTSDFLMRSQGIDVSIYEDVFLDKTLQKRITVTQCDSMDAYFALLEQSDKEGKLLIDSLQNNYSEFFRNSLTFAVLEHIVLPSLVLKKKKKRKEIRIWSTACAGGQEVYSLAMLLEEIRNGVKDKFKYRIFATDKSAEQINKARIGKYPSVALNNINFKRADKWFTKQNDIYTIKPELKEHIDFSVFDLLDQKYSSPSVSIFGDFDIVLCANLLFYFNPKIREQILDKVSRSIHEGGYLITGEAEREILIQEKLPRNYSAIGDISATIDHKAINKKFRKNEV